MPLNLEMYRLDRSDGTREYIVPCDTWRCWCRHGYVETLVESKRTGDGIVRINHRHYVVERDGDLYVLTRRIRTMEV